MISQKNSKTTMLLLIWINNCTFEVEICTNRNFKPFAKHSFIFEEFRDFSRVIVNEGFL